MPQDISAVRPTNDLYLYLTCVTRPYKFLHPPYSKFWLHYRKKGAGIAYSTRAGRSGLQTLARARYFSLLHTRPGWLWGPHSFPFNEYRRPWLWVKRPEPDIDLSIKFISDVTNEWSFNTAPSLRIWGVQTDKFTFSQLSDKSLWLFLCLQCGKKVKGKGRLWVLQHCCLEAYCTLTQMSSFIHLQRRCTHQAAWETSAREERNYTWNLASNP